MLCLATAGGVTRLAVAAFTLAWTHSVENVLWEEDWIVRGERLVIREARVRGSGAGMEPPEGAVLRDGAWRYTPDLPPLPEVILARSGATADWRICTGSGCRDLAAIVGPPDAGVTVRLHPCP